MTFRFNVFYMFHDYMMAPVSNQPPQAYIINALNIDLIWRGFDL